MTEQQTQLPDGWEWKQIKEFAFTTSGGTPKRSNPDFYNGDIPWVKSGDLNDGVLVDVDEYITEIGLEKSSAKLFEPKTVLVAMYGATIGKVAILGIRAATNQAVCGISLPVGYDSKYFFYFLRGIKKQLIEKGKGGAQPNINQQIIKETFVPVAPPEQQKQIVAKIEELFSHIDAGIESLEIAKQKLKQYRQSVLKAAVTGELTREWREANSPKIEPAGKLLQRILTERRQRWEQQQLKQFQTKGKPPQNDKWKEKYKEPEFIDASISINSWCIVSLEQIADVGTGATPKRGNPAYYEKGSIPWVTSGALNNEFITEASEYITELALKETNVSLFPKNTLLVAMYGEGKTRGKVSELIIEAGTNQACAGLVFDGLASKCRKYVKLFFYKNYDDIRRLSSGGVQPNLNLSIIKATQIPLVPLEEQKEIVRMVDEKLTAADRLMQELDTKLTQAQQQKQTILASAFKGELLYEE